MRNHEGPGWRQWLIFASLALMLCGLFAGRAVLSIGMLLFFATTFFHTSIGVQIKRFATTPLLLSMALLFLVPAISGLWSQDKNEWMNVLRTKLPLLAMPLAFAGTWQLQPRQWQWIGWLLLVLVTGGTLWSISSYLNDAATINEAYLKAKLIQTPLENDHIRFSWMVSVAVLAAALLWEKNATIWRRLLLITAIIWFVIYLHLAAARSGLACVYIMGLVFALRLLFTRSKMVAVAALITLMALPVLAWNFFPTFRNRLAYIRYDLSLAFSNQFVPGSNDGNRILSFRAAKDIISHHPLGVGAGDVWTETHRWYDTYNPGMAAQDRLLPSSEWLVYGCTAGWPGILVFTLAMLVPFLVQGIQHRTAWWLLNATAAAMLLFDIGLEVQFGVFLHCFFVLWWYKWLKQPAGGIA